MEKNKKCGGCNSASPIGLCRSYFDHNSVDFHHIFSHRFCPCSKCIVKVTCRDPKTHLNMFRYVKEQQRDCKLFFNAIQNFKKYVKDNNLRKTKIKIKRKK